MCIRDRDFGSFTAVSEKCKKKSDAEMFIGVSDTPIVKSVKVKEKSEKAPALYDLTTLQREANRKLGYTAQQDVYKRQLLQLSMVESGLWMRSEVF